MKEKFLVGTELRVNCVDGHIRFKLGKRIAIASKNIHHFEEEYPTHLYSNDADKHTSNSRIKNIILDRKYLGTRIFYSENNSRDCQKLNTILVVENFDECINQIKN